MSTYSPFQIFCIIFGGIGVLLGPMVMDGTPLHAGGSEFRLAPAPAIGKVKVVPAHGVVTALPEAVSRLLARFTVLPASENIGMFTKEEGEGNSELLGTLPSLGWS